MDYNASKSMQTAGSKTVIVKPSPSQSYALGFYENRVNEKTLHIF